jgi:hypothetical protein
MTTAEIIKMGVEAKSYPQFLFKYRADNSFTEKIISDNELYFSNPRIFNDPYDCNTPINTTTPLDGIKDWLRSVGIAPAHIDNCAILLQNNPNWMKDATDDALNKTGVCCFSTMDDSILQWSHYSDYHKGICLKFDITEDPDFFLLPVIVSYRKVMQHYNHFTQSDKIVEYLIQPKFAEWAYESEIRVVKPEPLMQANGKNRAFKYKDTALREVIFGTMTPEPIKDKYRQLCANNNKGHVQFFEMQLDSGVHYKLNKV